MISLRDHRAILRNGSGHTWDLGPALSNRKTSALQTGRRRGKRTISPARRTLFISFSVYLPVLSFCIFYPGIFLSHTKSYSPSLDLSFCLRLSTRSDRACVQRDNRITQARLCRRSRCSMDNTITFINMAALIVWTAFIKSAAFYAAGAVMETQRK